MTPAPKIRTSRLLLRQWRDDDYEPFAAMNADPRVMEFFPSALSNIESRQLADRIRMTIADRGYGNWAVEVPDGANFIGFIGLAVPRFHAHFTPCIEIGWRLGFDHWGKGYATEGATSVRDWAFAVLALPEIVSFTSEKNVRSRRVMERIGMTRDPADDFDHPGLPVGHSLLRHVLYRLRSNHVAISTT